MNGKNGHRIVSQKGRAADTEFNFAAAKVRARFMRDMFSSSLPDAAWNSFRVGDYDTAVFEAFKAVEVAVRKKANLSPRDYGVSLMEKAFNPANGPLTNPNAPPAKRNARCNLFKGAFGEIRNPKAHGDPTITDPLLGCPRVDDGEFALSDRRRGSLAGCGPELPISWKDKEPLGLRSRNRPPPALEVA